MMSSAFKSLWLVQDEARFITSFIKCVFPFLCFYSVYGAVK